LRADWNFNSVFLDNDVLRSCRCVSISEAVAHTARLDGRTNRDSAQARSQTNIEVTSRVASAAPSGLVLTAKYRSTHGDYSRFDNRRRPSSNVLKQRDAAWLLSFRQPDFLASEPNISKYCAGDLCGNEFSLCVCPWFGLSLYDCLGAIEPFS